MVEKFLRLFHGRRNELQITPCHRQQTTHPCLLIVDSPHSSSAHNSNNNSSRTTGRQHSPACCLSAGLSDKRVDMSTTDTGDNWWENIAVFASDYVPDSYSAGSSVETNHNLLAGLRENDFDTTNNSYSECAYYWRKGMLCVPYLLFSRRGCCHTGATIILLLVLVCMLVLFAAVYTCVPYARLLLCGGLSDMKRMSQPPEHSRAEVFQLSTFKVGFKSAPCLTTTQTTTVVL